MIIVLGSEPQSINNLSRRCKLLVNNVRGNKTPVVHFAEFISIPYPKNQPNSMPQFSDREKYGSDF